MTKQTNAILKATQLLGCVAFLTLSTFGCASAHPSLKALNPKEAKVEVWPNGEMRIHGEIVPIDQLSSYIEASTTKPQDPILICLNGDVDSYEMQMIRHRINDQMVRCKHFKYMYFSAPQASVSTLDPKTGTYTTYHQEGFADVSSGLEMHEDIYRFEAEQHAYQSGTYVSNALNVSANKKNGIQENEKDVAISIHSEELEDEAIRALKPNKTVATSPVTQPQAKPVFQRDNTSSTNEQDELRKIYERQQKKNRSKARVR